MSGWIERLAGKGKRGGSGVLVQISREVVGRRRSLQGAISEVRHPAVLDALSDDDFRELDEIIAERVESDREFALVLARLTHASAHAKGFDRQTVDAALRLDSLLPAEDPAREREKLLGDAYRAAQRAGYVQGGRRALARLGQRAALAGEPELARKLLQQQLELGPEANDEEDEVDSAILLGDLLHRDGDATHAIALFERAGRSAARIGYVHGLAPALLRQIDLRKATMNPADLLLLEQDALDAVAMNGDDAVQAKLIAEVGKGFITTGRTNEALQHLEDGLTWARDVGDMQLEQTLLEMLSGLERQLGHERETADRAGAPAQAGVVPRVSDDAIGHAKVLLSMGRMDQARDAFAQALESAQAAGDLGMEHRAAGGLGVTFTAMDRPVEALNHLLHALEIARAEGDAVHEAQWLGSIGEALWKFDQPDDAVQAIEQGLGVAHRIGDRDLEAGLVSMLGRIYISRRQLAKARGCYRHALDLYQGLGETQEVISTLSALGAISMDANRPYEAMELYGDALELAADAGERVAAVRLYGRLARLSQRQGDHEAALEALEQAVEVAETTDDQALYGQALQHLAVAQDEQGMPAALDTYERALVVARQIGDRSGEARMLVNVGARMLAEGQYRGAAQILQHAQGIIPDLGPSGDVLQERIDRLMQAATRAQERPAPRTTVQAGLSQRATVAPQSRQLVVKQTPAPQTTGARRSGGLPPVLANRDRGTYADNSL
ncbi:MAG: tetratricopeptide repeat protein [Thermomicrobiales bacterium]